MSLLHMVRAPLCLAQSWGYNSGCYSLVEQRGAHILLGDVSLLLGVVFLLLPVLLLQQLGQCLQGLGAAQRGPLGSAGVVPDEVNAPALHLHLQQEREASRAGWARAHSQLPLCT